MPTHQKSSRSRFLKFSGILLGLLLLLGVAAYLYISNNAERLISRIVESESNGKLEARMKWINFRFEKKLLNIREFELHTTDTTNAFSSYHFKVARLQLKVASIWDIVFGKKLIIDSLAINDPHFTVTQWKKPPAREKHISLHGELGIIYESLQKALQKLSINYFRLQGGRFSLINKIRHEQQPLLLSNLYLAIDNFSADGEIAGPENLLPGTLIFRTNQQKLILPDGKHTLEFGRLLLDAHNGDIEIDSCRLGTLSSDSASSEMDLYVEQIRILDIDFATLYKENLLKADSIYCLNTRMNGKFLKKQKSDSAEKAHHDLLRKIIAPLAMPLQVNYMGLHDTKLDLTTENLSHKQNRFVSDNINVKLYNIRISDTAEQPVMADSLFVDIKRHKTHTADSVYSITFDSIYIINQKLTLDNLRITTDPHAHVRVRRNHKIRKLELEDVDWFELINNNNFHARKVTLHSPIFQRSNLVPGKKKKGNSNLFNVLSHVAKRFNLEEFEIVNGEVHMDFNKSTSLQLSGANIKIETNQLMQADNFYDLERSLSRIEFNKGVLEAGDMELKMDKLRFAGAEEGLELNSLSTENEASGLKILLEQVRLKGFQFDGMNNEFNASSVSWKKAGIELHPKSKDAKPSSKAPPGLHLKNVQGAATRLNIYTNTSKIQVNLDEIGAAQLLKMPNKSPELEQFHASGSALSIAGEKNTISSKSFVIRQNQPSIIRDLSFEQKLKDDTLIAYIPEINIDPDLNKSLAGIISASEVRLQKPEIKIRKTKQDSIAINLNKGTNLPKLDINLLQLEDAAIDIVTKAPNGASIVKTKADISFSDIKTQEGNELAVGKLSNSLNDVYFHHNGLTIHSDKPVTAQLRSIVYNTDPAADTWKFKVEDATADQISVQSRKNDSTFTNLHFPSLDVKNVSLSKNLLKDKRRLVEQNTMSSVHADLLMETSRIKLQVKTFNLNASNKSVSLDSLYFSPVASRDSFIAAKPYQTNYMQVRSGPIVINDLGLGKFITDSVLHVGKITVMNPAISVFKDKRLPFRHGIIKPLPVNALKSISFPFRVDSVLIKDGHVTYSEMSPKTQEEGTIHLTRINGSLSPVMNEGLKVTDSLRLRADAYLMDKGWIALRYRESYLDTLAGFLLTVRMKPFDLTNMNSAIMPMISVKVKSGQLDTLHMRAIGREYLSLGEMKMFYRNLKVEFLKKGDETRKSLLTGLATFAANSLVVKTNNYDRIGKVYMPRDRERAVFQYWVKMALSGLASSVGAKSSRKYMKKYKRELDKRNLPPIDFE